MKRLLRVAPVCLLAFLACKKPVTTFPNPTLTIHASASSVGDLIEKEGAEVVATNSTGPEPLDPSQMKVVRDWNFVSIVGRTLDLSVSLDFTITPQGDACCVTVANGWQKDGHAKVPFLDVSRRRHEDTAHTLMEIKRRAEAQK